jgi:hypothetical protein
MAAQNAHKASHLVKKNSPLIRQRMLYRDVIQSNKRIMIPELKRNESKMLA